MNTRTPVGGGTKDLLAYACGGLIPYLPAMTFIEKKEIRADRIGPR